MRSTCQIKPGQYLIWFGCYCIHSYYWTYFFFSLYLYRFFCLASMFLCLVYYYLFIYFIRFSHQFGFSFNYPNFTQFITHKFFKIECFSSEKCSFIYIFIVLQTRKKKRKKLVGFNVLKSLWMNFFFVCMKWSFFKNKIKTTMYENWLECKWVKKKAT